jgi:hypothetical protein
MATQRFRRTTRAARALALAGCVSLAATALVGQAPPTQLDGKAPRRTFPARSTIRASFPEESYASGDRARLVIASTASNVRFQTFRAGTEHTSLKQRDVMLGSAVVPRRSLGDVRRGRVVILEIGDWPSGLYFAKLTGSGDRVGYAPFVVRPRRLGEHSVAVVLPTQTWQAYNFSDDDQDGTGDTWYASGTTSRTGRPFENRGVPMAYRAYDQPFLRWAQETGRSMDYLAQSDLNSVRSGNALANAYDLIVFPGHHEYVTTNEYDAIEKFRDLGGNLIFLSANNFFWKVTRRGNLMTRVKRWRDLGRPEAELIGVQYFGNDRGTHRAPWIVRDPSAGHGLLAAAGLRFGQAFARGGVEVDATTRRSPPRTEILAEVAWLHGKKAQMTYYESPAGAKVFAAGAFFLTREIRDPPVARLLDVLLTRLSRP